MNSQPWLAAIFAIIMLATAGYCVSRLALSWRRDRPTDRPVDAAHVLMGVAMAGMLVPRLHVVPVRGWEGIFLAGAVLFGVRLVRTRPAARGRPGQQGRAHDGQHLLGSGAMVYMLAAMAPAEHHAVAHRGAAASMAGAVPPVSGIALVLAVALFACVVWSMDRITVLAPVTVLADRVAVGHLLQSERPRRVLAGVPLSPRLAACCEVAMGITMGYMLIAVV